MPPRLVDYSREIKHLKKLLQSISVKKTCIKKKKKLETIKNFHK